MQYILTEQEYSDLTAKAAFRLKTTIQADQELCTKICNEMPITLDWGIWKEKPTPWGCMIDDDDWYCDECPVSKICPYNNKEWSK